MKHKMKEPLVILIIVILSIIGVYYLGPIIMGDPQNWLGR